MGLDAHGRDVGNCRGLFHNCPGHLTQRIRWEKRSTGWPARVWRHAGRLLAVALDTALDENVELSKPSLQLPVEDSAGRAWRTMAIHCNLLERLRDVNAMLNCGVRRVGMQDFVALPAVCELQAHFERHRDARSWAPADCALYLALDGGLRAVYGTLLTLFLLLRSSALLCAGWGGVRIFICRCSRQISFANILTLH